MRIFYIAHQLKNRKKILSIQKYLEYYLNLHFINPFYTYERKEIKEMDENKITRYIIEYDRAKQIVFDDLEMISLSDGVVCILYDRDAIGSFMEIFYCSYILKLPVYLITPDEHIKNHVWIKTLCWKIFDSTEDFEKYVQKNQNEFYD